MRSVKKAFQIVKRAYFLPSDAQIDAEADTPLSIGYGQTNSQPSTVRMMLEWLEVEPGQKILDVGSGSGWTTALLSYLTGEKGHIYAVEKVPELVDFGRDNCDRAGIKNADFFEAGNIFGLPEVAPFDRILVSASANELPQELLDQLKPGGKLVIPVKNDILEITKHDSGNIETAVHGGFVFVPLI